MSSSQRPNTTKSGKKPTSYVSREERMKFRLTDKKWVGKKITGQIDSLKRKLHLEKVKSPYTEYLYDILHEFTTAVLSREDEIAKDEAEEREAFERRQRQLEECYAQQAALKEQLAKLTERIDGLKRLNDDFSRQQFEGDSDPLPPRGPDELTEENFEPRKSHGQISSYDQSLYVARK